MWGTLEKLRRRVQELSLYRYREMVEISGWRMMSDDPGIANPPPPDMDPSAREVGVGERWGGRDRYFWLEAKVTLPTVGEHESIVGLFDLGATGEGNNSGFEGLLFLDGIPYQGVDRYHTEVFFPAGRGGDTVRLTIRLWTGLEGGGPQTPQEHQIRQTAIGKLDEITDDVYFTARAIWDTASTLAVDDPIQGELERALNEAFRGLDWRSPGSPSFYASVGQVQASLVQIMQGFEARSLGVTVHTVGHTHIDVAWLWRLRHTREKALRSFSTALRLMERFPEYLFLQSQPQLYAYVKEDSPEVYQAIRDRVTEGRWEPDGAMWLEADCNVPSGESLVRQVLLGTRYFEAEFGRSPEFLWLPDAFGFNAALPQILAKSGIHTFMTTKLSWNQTNRMPHDTFWWRGLDGSEVLAYFITTPPAPNDPGTTYNGNIRADSVLGTWKSYRDKGLNRDLLLSYGHGDGGGGPTREMLEMRRRLEHMPGLPRVVTTRAGDFFRRLHQTLRETKEYVATWDGELYLEYHRGTYTSQGQIKRSNRKLEIQLRTAEWMQVLAACAAGRDWNRYPHAQLEASWTILLRNQFHDILPGSSIAEVYEDARAEYATARQLAGQTVDHVMAQWLTPADGTYTIFNSAPWERHDRVMIPASKTLDAWIDDTGERVLSQWTREGWLVEVTIPPLGTATVRGLPDAPTDLAHATFEAGSRQLKTPFYEVEWNEAGQICRLYDRQAQREVLSDGEAANVFQIFEDKPLRFDAWDIDLFYQETQDDIPELSAWEITEAGPLRVVYHATWRYGPSTISQEMVFYARSRVIEFRTHVDWHQRQQLLKVAFPVAIRATEATYDMQFGNVRRPTHWNTSWDQARFETLAHQWADLSEYDYGVSLLNDSKYGHDIKDHVMRLSLLKSAIYPDPDADQGPHDFVYALLPHQGSWQDAHTVRAAWELNDPLAVWPGSPIEPIPSLFRFSGTPVMVDAIKKAEDTDRVLLRVHEYQGGRGQVEVESGWDLVSWQECDLRERAIADNITAPLCFEIGPYEIKTFLVDLGGLA